MNFCKQVYQQTAETDKRWREYNAELSSVNRWLEVRTQTARQVIPCTQDALLESLKQVDVSFCHMCVLS